MIYTMAANEKDTIKSLDPHPGLVLLFKAGNVKGRHVFVVTG